MLAYGRCMNAHTTINGSAGISPERLIRWRGRCLDYFARAESIVAKALIALGEPEELSRDHKKRCEFLMIALRTRSGMPRELVSALTFLVDRWSLRNAIVHGVANVFHGEAGTCLIFEHHPPQGGQDPTRLCIMSGEMKPVEDSLHRHLQVLEAAQRTGKFTPA